MRAMFSAATMIAILAVVNGSVWAKAGCGCSTGCGTVEPSCGQDAAPCKDYVTCRTKGKGCQTCATGCNSGCCQEGCGDCCKDGKCKHCCLGGGRGYEGLDRHYNCKCNGSYKFPVPPLSTYHWPGIYSHQTMTEYQSPWRFPPIKAYEEEKLEPRDPREALPAKNNNAQLNISDDVQQVDFSAPSNSRPGESESMSSKLKKLSRYAP